MQIYLGSGTMFAHSGPLLWQVINLAIVGVFLVLALWVFKDCRRQGKSISSSLLWSIIAFFILPPVGLLVYLLFMRKKWL